MLQLGVCPIIFFLSNYLFFVQYHSCTSSLDDACYARITIQKVKSLGSQQDGNKNADSETHGQNQAVMTLIYCCFFWELGDVSFSKAA